MRAAEKELARHPRRCSNWECELRGFLEEFVFRRRGVSTRLHSEETREISASVHGNDVTVKASREDADWLIQKFEESTKVKTQMIGKAADLNKPLQILNRTVRWSSRGLWAEEHLRHVKEVVNALGLENASPAPTTEVTAKGETRVKDDEGSISPELGPEETTMFRAVAARLKYLWPDARQYVRQHETVLKDVSVGRTRPEKNMNRFGRFFV